MMMKPQENKIKTVKPQYIPFKCPNCLGHGTVQFGKYTCKGCGGTGIINVPAEEVRE